MATSPEQHPSPTGNTALRGICLALGSVLGCGVMITLALPQRTAAEETPFIPLPKDAIPADTVGNPIMQLAARAISTTGESLSPKIPDAFVIRTDGGAVNYDSRSRKITYSGGKKPIFLRTAEGQEIYTRSLTADLDKKIATMHGPLVIYQGETLTLADYGTYNWESGHARAENVKAKVNGMLVRGSAVDYAKDASDKNYLTISDAFVSTEDIESPGMWVGTGKLTVYPGDYGVISRLSIAGERSDVPVPILGWVPISHSLNPREGYMAVPGVKSIWGVFLKNRYGFLLGNRRIEHGMPVSDYIATALLDYRSRRGVAGGLELTDEEMRRRYGASTGITFYFVADQDPTISPTQLTRSHVNRNRYRIAGEGFWELPSPETSASEAKWTSAVNINVLSDKYVLPDFYEEICRLDDKPDNSARIERSTDRSQAMLFTRLAPNNFYTTDQRAEVSYYRVRDTIGNTRIAYETNNSAGIYRQVLPADQRVLVQLRVSELTDPDLRDYYTRLLNTSDYARFNSTHELSTTFSLLNFLNVTPKVGAGFSGYYGVDNVGSDNRFLGYLACDFDIKFYRNFDSVRIPSMGIHGLYHIIHPYATISHGTVSSSNPMVPQIDTWSSTLGSSTVNPMPLDLMSFTGIDGWSRWTVWRIGAQNIVSTIYDGESRTLLNWNVFIDYNADNPNTESSFSNLYSLLTLHPGQRLRLNLETQTPTIKGGDGFSQYNTSVTLLPTRWLETQIGHRYISSHPVQGDASQMYLNINLRFNEKYTLATRLYWDIEEKRIPIQQYSLFRKFGAWYIGSTIFLRDNGGKKETGLGISFTLGETGTSLPINFF